MGFTLIKGMFKPKAGIPDGDSVRFFPNDSSLLDNLVGVKAKISTSAKAIGTVQLRFEGIDAIEKRAIKPLSIEAKQNMFKLIDYDADTNPEPKGFILSRMTDPHGRPISFVFSGDISEQDGSNIFLDANLLESSVNYKQMKDGFAYPLYYNTLFAPLRNKFDEALMYAKQSKNGYWRTDKTMEGVEPNDKSSLFTIAPIWPKLWRRLEEYYRNQTSLDEFLNWVDEKKERILIINSSDETGLANIINVTNNVVRLLERPENIMVITAIKR